MRRMVAVIVVAGLWVSTGPAAGATPKLLDEEYQALYLGKSKIGYIHVQNFEEEKDGRKVIHTRTLQKLELMRSRQIMRISSTTDEYADPDGKLLEARSVNQQQGSRTVVEGKVVGDQMRITITSSAGKRALEPIAWDGTVLGSHAAEILFKKEKFEPGKVWKLKVLSLEMQSIGIDNVAIKVIGRDTTELLGGEKKEFWKADVTSSMRPGIVVSVWADEDVVHKTYVPILAGMYTYRVTAAQALAPTEGIRVDAMLKSLVKLDKPLPRPYRTKEVVYDVELAKPELADLFTHPPSQTVVSKGGEGKLRLRVQRQKPPAAPATQPAVDAVYTKPNAYIQSDDEKVQALAAKAAGDATDPIEVVTRLTRWVAKYVNKKNYSTGMATAADVARTRAGDCTEHAVLLAAVARARGIPSRVAVGMIYMRPNHAFAYHMWTEVFVGQWLSVDGTGGWVGVPPTHIKLADSSLNEASGMTAMLPAVRLIGHVQIKLVSYKH